jgi:dTDP-4-amino-4,6-dideoxygalactose transaminase
MSKRRPLKAAALSSDFIVVGRPFIGQAEIKEVVATLKSGWWASGPKTELFEEKFRHYIGSKYAVAVNSCTAGMHIALRAAGIGSGDEVVTTPMTFASTATSIIHAGATPVFADILPGTGMIDPDEVIKKITKHTRAIMPVHLYGRPCNLEKLRAIARKHKLIIIEDAAHAIEGRYRGQHIGSAGDMAVFSFYATKNMATGEGGMVTTNNPAWAKALKLWRFHGLSKDPYERNVGRRSGDYECVLPGYSFPMTDIQASLGIHQLARIEANLRIRQHYWDMYDDGLQDVPGLELPQAQEPKTRHARHLYTVLAQPSILGLTRDQFAQQLWQNKIGTIVHFTPLHLHRYYRERFGYAPGDFPNTEDWGDRIISLPSSASLKPWQVKRVIAAIKKVALEA